MKWEVTPPTGKSTLKNAGFIIVNKVNRFSINGMVKVTPKDNIDYKRRRWNYEKWKLNQILQFKG